MSKSNIDCWANFLMNEKLEPSTVGEENTPVLIYLAEKAGEIRRPNISMHKHKLESRAFLCKLAMDLGIDLPALKNNKGKMSMSRGLLDAWNKAYKEKFGSTVGTASEYEATRRDVKTDLWPRVKGIKRNYEPQKTDNHN